MGEMRRANTREEQERRNQDRFASTIVIAAAIIAAVRLARDDISSPSPRIYAAVADSVNLARKILQKSNGRMNVFAETPKVGDDLPECQILTRRAFLGTYAKPRKPQIEVGERVA